jgi:glycosidase
MQWQPGPQAGFSTVEPWLPLDPQAQTCNVEVRSGGIGTRPSPISSP